MGKLIRINFLKLPPRYIQLNESFKFSATISTDLGLLPDLDLPSLPIAVRLVPLDQGSAVQMNQMKQSIQFNLIQPKPIQINKALVKDAALMAQCELPSQGGYIEWNFTCSIQPSQKNSKFALDKLSFQVCLELGDYWPGQDLKAHKFPGGNAIEDLYLLSLYSLPIQITSKLPSSNGALVPIPFTSKDDVDLERISHERRYYMSPVPSEKYIRLLEIPLGRDLGSHGWDCSYIGLHFLQSILFRESVPSELNIVEKCKVNIELVQRIRDNLVPKPGSKAPVKIIELGVGVGLFSIGLSQTFRELYEINQQHSKTKGEQWKYEFILTDLPIILNGTRRQIVANPTDAKSKSNFTANLTPMVLDWEAPTNAENAQTLAGLNWIFAYDVVYNNTAHKPLLNTLMQLTETNDIFIILGYKVRNQSVEQDFFKMCKPYFNMTKLLTYYQIHLILLTRKRD